MKFASRPVNIKKFPLHSPELSWFGKNIQVQEV